MLFFFFFKQKTAYEMRISDWSSDVCSSDLAPRLSAASVPGAAKRREPEIRGKRKGGAGSEMDGDATAVYRGKSRAASRKRLIRLAFPKQVRGTGRISVDRKSTRLNSSH